LQASRFDARFDQVDQCRIEFRFKRHDVKPGVVGEQRISRAFYGVLLGDQRTVERTSTNGLRAKS